MKGLPALEGYENQVFVTKNNRPTQQYIVEEAIDYINKAFEVATAEKWQ